MPLPCKPSSLPANVLEFRGKVDTLEARMKQLPKEVQVEIKAVHTMAKGLYARSIIIPKGVLAVGSILKEESINVVVFGDMTLATEEGPVRLVGPAVFVSKPGLKKCGYAHTDTMWITLHANPNDEQDVERLEKMIVSPDYEDMLMQRALSEGETKCLS